MLPPLWGRIERKRIERAKRPSPKSPFRSARAGLTLHRTVLRPSPGTWFPASGRGHFRRVCGSGHGTCPARAWVAAIAMEGCADHLKAMVIGVALCFARYVAPLELLTGVLRPHVVQRRFDQVAAHVDVLQGLRRYFLGTLLLTSLVHLEKSVSEICVDPKTGFALIRPEPLQSAHLRGCGSSCCC